MAQPRGYPPGEIPFEKKIQAARWGQPAVQLP
jgi:hypothetical protein